MIDFGEHLPEKKGLDLTPMIDVVFLLLIFFLITSIFSKPTLPLDLPAAETASPTPEPEVSVALKMDGSLLLNGSPVSLEDLGASLHASYAGRKQRDLSLLSDKVVPFGRVVEVMDLARKAGAENISVVAEKKR